MKTAFFFGLALAHRRILFLSFLHTTCLVTIFSPFLDWHTDRLLHLLSEERLLLSF